MQEWAAAAPQRRRSGMLSVPPQAVGRLRPLPAILRLLPHARAHARAEMRPASRALVLALCLALAAAAAAQPAPAPAAESGLKDLREALNRCLLTPQMLQG